MMRIGLSTLCWIRLPFDEMVKRLSASDIDCVEIVDCGLHTLNSRRIAELRKTARAVGIEVAVHAPWLGLNLSVPTSGVREATLKALEKSLRNASELGASVWVLHAGAKILLPPFSQDVWETNLKGVDRLCRSAQKYGVKVGLENGWVKDVLSSVDEMVAFKSALGCDVEFTLDVAHARLVEDPTRFIETLGKSIIHVHVSDNHGASDEHLAIGLGNTNWKEVSAALKKAGYGGMVIVETVDAAEQSVELLRALLQH